MYPILYETMTEGTVPTHNGLGVLSDCLSCQVTEERNGAYELTMSYTTGGIHASDIQVNRFIMAKPNFADDPQIFRIYRVGKDIGGQFTVSAQHISYDLSGKIITTGTANDIITACQVLQAKAGAFTISTDKVTAGAFKVNVASSVRSWFGGKDGSLLDVYGSGEFHYDNYAVSLKQNRGMNRGVVIRYGKNLTELAQELDMSNLCTGVVPYYVDINGNTYTEAKVSTGLTLDVPRDMAIDFSDQVNPDSETPIRTQLTALATAYVANNNLTNILDTITLNFVQISTLTERVDLCDTVTIHVEALGISGTAKCVSTTWDVLHDRYSSTTFGNPKTNIADTIAVTQQAAQEAVTKSFMDIAIGHATEAITGNLGGYVVLHDSDADGAPDEILIMDTPDITTATKVWRWNSGGLGFSPNGYAGPYNAVAIDMQGRIVADAITTGTLNAGLIKAGILQDFSGNSSINMTTGEAILKNMKAKSSFTLIDSKNIARAKIGYSVGEGTFYRGINSLGDVVVAIEALPDNNGLIGISDNAQHRIISLQKGTHGGEMLLNSLTSKRLINLTSGSGGGFIQIYNSSENKNIMLSSGSAGGYLEALSSSEKVCASISAAANGTGGDVSVYNTSEKIRVHLWNGSNGGGMNIYNSSDKVTFSLENDGNQNGLFSLSRSNGNVGIQMTIVTAGGQISVWNSNENLNCLIGSTTNGGNFTIRNHSGTYNFLADTDASGSGQVFVYDSNGSGKIHLQGQTGTVTCVSVVQTSSKKVKKNVKPIKDWKKILDLEAVTFDYKDKLLGSDRRGFIAEDVAEVLPNLVTPETEDTAAAIDYIQMIPYLQAVIKDQEARIKALEDKIKKLEAK